MSDSDADDGKTTSNDVVPGKEKRDESDGGEAEEEDDDEDSVVERSSDLFGDDEDEEEQQQLQIQQQLALMDEDDMGAQSQVPRGFMERMFWNESDVRFRNDTNREVLFIIADEEFTMQRTTKIGAGLNDGDDDDDDDDDRGGGNLLGGMNNFGLNLIPLNATAYANRSTTVTQHALKTRCMPVAPKSHSTQHFQQERLTYVTALTKDVDGEGQPWTRVHYENKVINCQRTKSLTFSGKHLRVSAYRITQQQKQPQGLLQNQKQSSKRRLAATAAASPSGSAAGTNSSSRALVVRQKSNKRIRTID